ncbi:S49 family peptidase [Actinoalloteichus caeruleus]|uniref:Signal peptide peptidase SppA n=1 Tax=Actinoalloteichus caeruleus DSM 43889 TaxID=1120930 RepID=A0ABT1JK39_ACTCY|nr:S49 family peptidase [Actinoalloteichus caeruleus]MCP2332875.1 signal peptide peptidase SppA [Actinoalloteichus caeruleus DSM 43889]
MSMTDKLTSKLPGRLGERVDRSPIVAVVRLHGVISSNPSPVNRGTINLASVEAPLTRAFGHERLAAVVLLVNSPGGSPTQSALVADRVRELADRRARTRGPVPVLAFCEDAAASGGYWLACAADEIYAHPSSLVGSIGVVSSGFGFTGLLERLGVERRLHATGEHKTRLDPFLPEREDDVAWLLEVQRDLHGQFVDWVRARRGDRLAGEDETLFSGEVWTGARARELGLVDGLGTLRKIVSTRFPDAEIAVSEPKRPLLARLGLGGASGSGSRAGDSLLAAVEGLNNRAVWSRLGL